MINEDLLVAGMTKFKFITEGNIINAYRITQIDNDKVYYTEFKQYSTNRGLGSEGEKAYISKKSIKDIKKLK